MPPYKGPRTAVQSMGPFGLEFSGGSPGGVIVMVWQPGPRRSPADVTTVGRSWLVAVALTVAAVAAIAGVLYVRSRPGPTSASAVVSVSARPGHPNADAVREGAPRYVSLAIARRMIRALAVRLGEDRVGLGQALDVVLVPGTPNVKLTVRGLGPKRSVAAVNAVARQLARASDRDPEFGVQVLTLADPPPPSPLLVEALVVAAALALGAMAATVIEAARRALWAIRDAGSADVAVPPGYELLGVVPRMNPPVPPDRFLTNPEWADPETLRAGGEISENVARTMGGQTRGVILVVCPTAEQGATTTAQLLAASLSDVDAAVLLVDLHPGNGAMRHPAAARRPDPAVDGAEGLDVSANWMGQVWLVRRGVCLLPLGRAAEPPPEPDTVSAILREAREMFETVIVDSPLSPPKRAQQLASLADGVVVVLPLDGVSRNVRKALDTLRAYSPESAGVVVSASPSSPRSGRGTAGSGGRRGTPARADPPA